MRELNPVQWAVLPLKKYADFSGRAPRAEYWWFYLGTVIVGIVCAGIDVALGTKDVVGNVASLALLLPSLSVTVRRLHDIGRTGWWLIAFVPIIAIAGLGAFLLGTPAGQGAGSMGGMLGLVIVALIALMVGGITMLVFMVTEGTQGDNRYGPDPYGPDNLEQVFA